MSEAPIPDHRPVALLIAKNWPEPASTAAGRRTLDLLALIDAAGYRVHVASAAEPTPFQADLSGLGYPVHRIAVNDSAFDPWVGRLDPALVVYDRYVMEEQFGWRVHEQCPRALTLLDTSDFHTLREARQQAVLKQRPVDLFNDTAVRELGAMARCDLVVMISRVEIDLLVRRFGLAPEGLLYLPFLVRTLPDDAALPGFDEREHLMMIGGFKHPPNRDAVHWMRHTLWPRVRARLPGVECHVYGAYADHASQRWHAPNQGFLMKGRADDALATMQRYRLNLAPLRFGAGQKGKILDGWLSGTPTVTTPVGAEAMLDPDAWGYPVSERPDVLAEAIVRLYQDRTAWHDTRHRGFAALKSGFTHQYHAPGFIQRLRDTARNLDEHRRGRIWGRILWQSQYRATEFMSRWIEAKNAGRAPDASDGTRS